jgi:transposase
MVVAPESLASLNAEQLREMTSDLIAKIATQDAQIMQRDLQITSLDQAITSKDREIKYRQAKIDQLTHEMAVLKRLASLAAAESS